MTPPSHHFLRHATPLLLGNWLQLSYNAVDTIIAGRFIGQEALAAEGIAGPVMNLLILAISGLCIGAGILMSEAFGTKEYPWLQKILGNTLCAGCAACCLLALGGILLAEPILLGLLAVPEDIFARSSTMAAPPPCWPLRFPTILSSVNGKPEKTPLKKQTSLRANSQTGSQ